MKVLLAHPGTQYSYQLARQLFERNLLFEFHTGFAFGKDSAFYRFCRLLPNFLYRKISNRFVEGVPDRKIVRHLWNELLSVLLVRIGLSNEWIFFNRNRRFQQQISEESIRQSDVIVGFDTSSWILIKRAHLNGKKFILDVSIGHPVVKDEVYSTIRDAYPEWSFNLKKKKPRYLELEYAEMRDSDQIVVASSFSRFTYVQQGIPAEKIVVIPYGVEADKFRFSQKSIETKKLRFVFVGLVDARKGVPLLLDAWREISHENAELTLIGPVSNSIRAIIQQFDPSIKIIGRLSFDEICLRLTEYDVLVFPSFFEGFGLVIPESMAAGLPVIVTDATCGPDLMVNQKHGFLISAGDKLALVDAMNYFINNREFVSKMGLEARLKSKEYSWNKYGQKWQIFLSGID